MSDGEMIYRTATAFALGYLCSSAAGFAPGVAPARFPTTAGVSSSPSIARMSVAGGTETVDFTAGTVRPQRDVVDEQMRPRPGIDWSGMRDRLAIDFRLSEEELAKYDSLEADDLLKAYETMQLCRQFENACNQAYMQGHIRGFMHLDNGQETIPALIADSIKQGDIKYSYYREHTHAIASGVDAGVSGITVAAGSGCEQGWAI